jgi:mono/diheme cytochrome c family protein
VTVTPCRSLLAVVAVLAGGPGGAADDFFSRRVAPVLRERCLQCHGSVRARGGLSLASRADLLRGGDQGPALVPGKSADSLLLQLVKGSKPVMPRKGAPLTPRQVADLAKWIDDGAAWPEGVVLSAKDGKPVVDANWWSLRPLQRPALPTVKARRWLRTPVDVFVLAGLEAKGLRPAPAADRATLIRRVTFDLHGLPPTPDEVRAFVADTRPDAYERLIDRLLASPRCGERWGRHWLDVVHYGDTHGYDKDKRRDQAWPYRDYVIRAFNSDKPYARFIREQVAGDVLYPGDPDGVVATGFIAAGPWDFVGHVELREGTVEKMKTRVLDRDDMVASTISTFVSMTVHCARCHNHKFDPIPQRDYYRLQAVFAGVERGNRPFDTPARAAQRDLLQRRHQRLQARQAEILKSIAALSSPELARADAVVKDLRRKLAALPPLAGGKPSPTNGYHSGITRSAEVRKWVQVDLGASLPLDAIRLIPARPTDFPDTPGFGFPTRFRVEVSDDPAFIRADVVADHTRADYPNPGDRPVLLSPTRKKARYVRVTAEKLWRRTGDYCFALAELQVEASGKNVALRKSVTALDSIEAGRWSKRYLVDNFDSRRQLPDVSDPRTAALLKQRSALEVQVSQAEQQRRRLQDRFIDADTRAELKRVAAALRATEGELRALPAGQQVYAVVPRPPRSIHVLARGDVEKPGALAEPGTLSCVPGLAPLFKVPENGGEGARRVALADWLASPKNVLTWRSLANRVWVGHFGRGLVDTPNDFGGNGSRPTHPELLDWLACELRDNGGSLKKLHRLILISSTYRQSSRHDEAMARLDADNRWLWRMNRLRLDAEEVRDSVLAVSGQLNLTMGGLGYDLFRFKDDHSPIYDHSALEKIHDPATYRRTVYRFIVRSVPNPFLECLDCADPNINTPVRNTTLTALQALALLNDPFMVRQAEFFAQRLRKVSAVPARQVEAGYLLAFGRPPTGEERAALAAYAGKHGLANACRLLFNANEFLFID